MRVAILGGGVIGTSIAYFLSVRGATPIVIERTGVACGASGKSGGFLALDWCDGSPLEPLARRSFDLHAELAAAPGADWGYRRVETLAVVAQAGRSLRSRGTATRPDWLAGDAAVQGQLGNPATTAQIDPAGFTQAMLAAALDRGGQLRMGQARGLVWAESGQTVTGVMVDDDIVPADAVVIAMGPWSVLACRWLPLPPVYGLKGHSVVFRARAPISPHALFVDVQDADGAHDTPEVMPRPDGTTYVCGLSSRAPLPVDPAEVVPDPGACERLRAMIGTYAPLLGEGELLAAQACHRPVTQDGLPLIGRVAEGANVYVATGHSVWGMLNGPATGEALAELIVDDASTGVDLGAFDPARLAPLDPGDLETSRVTAGRSPQG